MAKRLINGDSRIELGKFEADSVDACVTDPPYHLTSIVKRFGRANAAPCQEGTDGAFARAAKGFMGKEWDGGDIAFDPLFWTEVYRVLKPGAHLLAFGGTRTFHRMACAIEDAGFEIRDTLMYCYASGFPKSHNVSAGIDRLNGDERPVVGNGKSGKTAIWTPGATMGEYAITSAASAASAALDGWGTALKPSVEPIVMARKPLTESSVARNVLAYGTGAINIDACRIGTGDVLSGSGTPPLRFNGANARPFHADAEPQGCNQHGQGRWPSNLILSCQCDTPHDAACPVAILDAQSGGAGGGIATGNLEPCSTDTDWNMRRVPGGFGDSGGASRFYFVAKPSRREKGERNIHPTVKPVELMKYLCRLVCPPGSTILDPFMGSGTTGIGATLGGFDFVGIEREADYFRIAEMRNGLWREYEDEPTAAVDGQMGLFASEAV